MEYAIICYHADDGTDGFEKRVVPYGIEDAMTNFEEEYPDRTVVHAFAANDDFLARMDAMAQTFTDRAEEFGFAMSDRNRECNINGSRCKLVSFRKKAKKYKCIWQYMDQPGRYVRTTVQYAHALLNACPANE